MQIALACSAQETTNEIINQISSSNACDKEIQVVLACCIEEALNEIINEITSSNMDTISTIEEELFQTVLKTSF